MPRHRPPRRIEDDDTITLILRSLLNQPVTIETTNGVEYNGLLSDISIGDNRGKKVWLHLEHVTAHTQFDQFVLFKPIENPSTRPEIDRSFDNTPQSTDIQRVLGEFPILNKIKDFDFVKFLNLDQIGRNHVIEHLEQQEERDLENYQRYGQYISSTMIEMGNVAKIHCPQNLDFLNNLQSYISRLKRLQQKESMGKGVKRKNEKELLMVQQLKMQYPHLGDDIDEMVMNMMGDYGEDELGKPGGNKHLKSNSKNQNNNQNNEKRKQQPQQINQELNKRQKIGDYNYLSSSGGGQNDRNSALTTPTTTSTLPLSENQHRSLFVIDQTMAQNDEGDYDEYFDDCAEYYDEIDG